MMESAAALNGDRLRFVVFNVRINKLLAPYLGFIGRIYTLFYERSNFLKGAIV